MNSKASPDSCYEIPLALWNQSAPASSRLVCTEDVQKIISCTPHGATLWQANNGTLWQALQSQSLQFNTHSVVCTEDYVVVGDAENIQIFDKSGRAGRLLNGHTNTVIEMIFTKGQGTFLLSASRDKTIRFWNTQAFAQTSIYPQHSRALTCVQLTRDEKMVVTSSLDGTVRCWDAVTGRFQKILKFGDFGITVLHLDKQGQFVIVGDEQGCIYIHNLKTESLDKFKAHKGPVLSLDSFTNGS